MSAVLSDFEVPQAEIESLTKYKRPSKQLEVLRAMGIPARMRRDHTVLVLKMDLTYRSGQPAANETPVAARPKLKPKKR